MAALIAYRHVLRSVRLAFQGDIATLTAARFQARQTFEHNRNLEGEEAKNGIAQAEDVARILRENVVQGVAQEQDKQLYKLRIHEHTERGDNESIKVAGKKNTLTPGQGGCCSA